jgi:alpha 1,2-mannosyltransferase
MDKRFPLKAIAIAYSRFRHVLSLDADNFPAHNPERLLRSGGYVRTGAMFWPDFWPLEDTNPIWHHLDKNPVQGMQQESGQLLIDKQQHWKPLLLALYMNLESKFYYTMLQVSLSLE